MLRILLIAGTFFLTHASPTRAAMNCSQIRAMAGAAFENKKTKSACVLIEHTLGISPGSTETVYSCKGKKYKLNQLESGQCSVTSAK